MKIKVKKLHPDAVIPKYAKPGDSGFDLVATEDVVIEPGQTALVPTGLAFEIPVSYELQVRPRSGLSLKTKLRVANTPGTVDACYRGEVKVIMDNIHQKERGHSWNLETLDDELVPYRKFIECGWSDAFTAIGTYLIRKGDRIAQGVIQPVKIAELVESEDLSDSVRGEDGFGSSGVKA